MKNILFILILLLFSCEKDEVEESINFDLDASAVIINPSNNFEFNVILKSKMPKSGIKIEVTAVDEVSGTEIAPQLPSFNTSQATMKTLVKSLPRQKWVVVTVKVSSVKTSINNSSKTFRIIYK